MVLGSPPGVGPPPPPPPPDPEQLVRAITIKNWDNKKNNFPTRPPFRDRALELESFPKAEAVGGPYLKNLNK